MKNKTITTLKKIIALVSALVLVITTTMYSYAQISLKTKKMNENPKTDVLEADEDDKATDNIGSKDETVYVIADANGESKKVIVSEHLVNTNDSTKLMDVSTLTDIKNVKGDEQYDTDGDKIVWNCEGEDIYYQGNSTTELPVEIKITYTLDGKEIKPEELEGKAGKLVITIEYINNTKTSVKLDNRDCDMYVPFAVIAGTILNNDNYKNITIKNGKLIDDSSSTVVIAYGAPMLMESLQMENEDDMFNKTVISADVTDAASSTFMAVASNSIINEALKTINGIDTKTNTDDNQTNDITNVIESIQTSVNELIAGIEKLNTGAKALYSGVNELTTGISDLSNGINTFKTKLEQISAGSTSINAGAKKVFETLLANATAQLTQALNPYGITVPTLTIENYTTVLDGIISATQSAQVIGVKESLNSYNAFYTGLLSYTQYVDAAAVGAGELYTGSQKALVGANNVVAGAKQLSEGTEQLKSSISLMVSSITTKLNGIDILVTELEKLSLSYDNYAGKDEGYTGSTKFIFKAE